MKAELTPNIVKAIAREFGYVTNGQSSNIAEACEHYIAGKSVAESVKEVTGECEHNWIAISWSPSEGSVYECTICGETSDES